jgi:diphosphomevalonate decarboxylase
VVSDKEKDTSSTSGMETSKATSDLLKFRAEKLVEPRLAELEAAFKKKEFDKFGKLTMQDSNQFHATCLDTYPPIFYLNDVSKAIMRLVHVINEFYGRVVCAYTYDAGPNAVIYLLENDCPLVMAVMTKYFPAPGKVSAYCNDADFYSKVNADMSLIIPELLAKLDKTGRVPFAGDVKYIFYTKSGPGPICQPLEESLLDPVTGLPMPAGSAVYSRHKRMQITPVNPTESSSMFFWSLVTAAAAVGVVGGMLIAKHLKR